MKLFGITGIGAVVVPLLAASGLQAQTVWIDGIGTLFDDDMDPLTPEVPDDNGAGNWDDILKWDTGVVPSGPGVIVDFKNGYTDSNIPITIRADREPHLTDGTITVGILNFEDTAPDGNDTNFAYEGETDFILLGNDGAVLTFDNGATPTLDGPAAELNYTLAYREFDVVRFGRDGRLAIDGTNGLLVNTSGEVIFDADNFIEGPIVVRAIDSGPLSDLGDQTNTVPNPGPDGREDGDGGGDGRIRLEANFGLGATGPGNETVLMGFGGPDQFGANNRKKPGLRFSIDDTGAAWFDIVTDPALDGSRDGDGGLQTGYTIEEEFHFRFFPAGDGVFARTTWQEAIHVLDDVPVTLNGDLYLERGVDWDGFLVGEDALSDTGNIEGANVRWEIQVGDTATSGNAARGDWDTNHEMITINGDIIFNDQSGADDTGRFRNIVEMNPVNETSTIIVNGSVGTSAEEARDASEDDFLTTLRYQGILMNGDGSLVLNGDNGFDGNLVINRGTVRLTNEGAVRAAWNVNLGAGGTNADDVLRFMIGAEGVFPLGAQDNNKRNINLDDVAGNSSDPEQDNPAILPYVIGMDVAGVAELDFNQLSYQGDGFNENANNMNAQLDSLDVTIEFTAVEGAQLTLDGRIQGQELNTPTFPDPADPASLGTVTLNKTGAGTIILDEERAIAHQYSGPTNVLEGTLILNDQSQKTTSLTVSAGAVLGGEGAVGDATDVDDYADRANDGIDNDNDGLIDGADGDGGETGWYQVSDGDPTTGNGNPLFGGANANAAVRDRRHRPKVSTAVTFEAGSAFEPGSRDAAEQSLVGQFEVEGSVNFGGATELRFDLDVPGTNDVLNVVDDQLAGGAAGTVTFSGSDTLIFTNAGGLADGTYVLMTTANGLNGALPTVDVARSTPGFDYVVSRNGNALEVTVTSTGGPVDADGDGIPADVEAANGLSDSDPDDARSDLDGDGFAALFEFAMGTITAAGDSGSPIWLVEHVSATEVNITYGPIVNGRTYLLNASADGQTFAQIDSFTATADEATRTVTDSSGDLDVELYQLEVPLP